MTWVSRETTAARRAALHASQVSECQSQLERIYARRRARTAPNVPCGTLEKAPSSPAAEELPLQVPQTAEVSLITSAAPSAGPPGPPDSPGDPAHGTTSDVPTLEWEVIAVKPPRRPWQSRSTCRRFCIDKLRNGESYVAWLTGTGYPIHIGEYPSYAAAQSACVEAGISRGFT